jgi:hypothetical protein
MFWLVIIILALHSKWVRRTSFIIGIVVVLICAVVVGALSIAIAAEISVWIDTCSVVIRSLIVRWMDRISNIVRHIATSVVILIVVVVIIRSVLVVRMLLLLLLLLLRILMQRASVIRVKDVLAVGHHSNIALRVLLLVCGFLVFLL